MKNAPTNWGDRAVSPLTAEVMVLRFRSQEPLCPLRLGGKSGQIKPTDPESNQNQADSNQKSGSATRTLTKKSAFICGICGSNLVFKIKKPSQYTQKIGKVRQGKASVSAPPGTPPCLAPTATRLSHKTPYFQPFYPRSNASIHVVFTPKNTSIYPQKHANFDVFSAASFLCFSQPSTHPTHNF